MRFVFVLLLSVGLSLLHQSGLYAVEKPTLKSVTYERQQGGTEVVQFRLNGAHIPKIFMLTGEKPRLVVDFLDIRYRGQSRFSPENTSLIQGIRIGIHEKPKMKTRVVIDLTRDQAVSWQQDFLVHDNRLVITIEEEAGGGTQQEDDSPGPEVPPSVEQKEEGPEKAVSKTPPGLSLEEQSGEQGGELTAGIPVVVRESTSTVREDEPQLLGSDEPVLLDVSFERDPEKGEMILFKLDDFHPPVVSAIEKGTPRIVCDFYNMRIAGEVKGTIAVAGEYVAKVRVARHENPGKVRAVLDLVPGRDYGLQQVFFNEDNLFVLIVNLLAPDLAAEKAQ